MGKKFKVVLLNGTESTYEDARVVEGIKTWIYQINETEFPVELLAFIDPYQIKTLFSEENWSPPRDNQQTWLEVMLLSPR